MGRTIKKHYDRYSLEFKLRALALADHPNITALAVAESLDTSGHAVSLAPGEEERHLARKRTETKRVLQRSDALVTKEAELLKAQKRIKELERSLESKQEELDILKKAKRFFSKAKR